MKKTYIQTSFGEIQIIEKKGEFIILREGSVIYSCTQTLDPNLLGKAEEWKDWGPIK